TPLNLFGRARGRYIQRQSKHGGVLLSLVLQRRFAPHFCAPLPGYALVDCDAMEPGRNLGLASKAAQVSKRGEKSLLGRIARIFFATQHAKGQSEDASLPTAHNLSERLG